MEEPRDITQHLLRFSPDALIVIDAGGQIRFANETVTAWFGYAPEQQQERAIEGMTRMFNALLDISRLESGAIEPAPSAWGWAWAWRS